MVVQQIVLAVKKGACTSALLLAIGCNSLTAQQNRGDFEVPQAFKKQFVADNKKYLDSTNPYVDKAGRAFNYWEQSAGGHFQYLNRDSLYAVYLAFKKLEFQKKVAYFVAHPDSYVSLYYFNQYLLAIEQVAPDTLMNIYRQFTKRLRVTPLGKSVYAAIKRKEKLQLACMVPDFHFNTAEGKSVRLSSFRGQKNILLCFWASWCGPCVANIPLLKQVEEQYRDKGLQLISVSIDKDNAQWLAALQKYAMPWLQTCDLPAYMPQNRVRSLYEISAIPRYFLLNREGRLVYHNVLSRENDSYDTLKQRLQQLMD